MYIAEWLADHFDNYGNLNECEEHNGLDYDEPDGDPEDEWACEFGVDCLMPSRHMRSECYTVEMALDWEDEQMREAS